MSNQQEVELRAFITKEQTSKIKKSLEKHFVKKIYIKDVYFCKNNVKKFKDVEMDNVGSFSLRIRKSISNGKTINTLNMKVITTFSDHHAWDEHETTIDPSSDTLSILKNLGYKSFFSLEKTRYTYKLGKLTINLEDFINEDPAIEVEIMTNIQKADSAKNEIREFFGRYNIHEKQIVKKSLTNILMHKSANF